MVDQPVSGNNLSLPPDDKRLDWLHWLWAEVKYHLFPWGPGFLIQKPAMVAASIGLAVAVTVAWVLAATGRVAPVVVIAWWTGWSVYEFICRMRCKPWVKEGPWWGRQYRRANIPDMIAYVATKNLLIGAGLFWLLYLLGVLPGAVN
jgi:NosR/NirI family nitrous oxide reductase transcriptional regulator